MAPLTRVALLYRAIIMISTAVVSCCLSCREVVRFCSSFDVLKTCLSEMCYECVNGAPLTSVFVLTVLRDTHCVTTAAAAADDDDAFPARLPSGTQDCTV